MTKSLFSTLLAALLAAALPHPAHANEHPAGEAAAEKPAESGENKHAFPPAGETVIVGQEEVEKMTRQHGADLLVLNFWATSCGPCIEEMPYFVEVAKEHNRDRILVLGVSVDLKRDVESRVIPFLKEREIPYPNVVFFDDPEPMIEFFSPEWTGEIPATFFYDKSGKKIGEFLRPVSREELKQKVKSLLPAEEKN